MDFLKPEHETGYLMKNPCVIEKYIVNFTYVVNDNRLGCFVYGKQTRKITFIYCLISCHPTLTWNKCKDTLSTIFPYTIKKISRKWQHWISKGGRLCTTLHFCAFYSIIFPCWLLFLNLFSVFFNFICSLYFSKSNWIFSTFFSRTKRSKFWMFLYQD